MPRASARHYYGAPGSVVHHNTDLWRFTQPVEGTPVWANWTATLPWLLAQVWDHWAYGSGDDDFARNRLLPMLAQAARFALFMLVEDDDGLLVVSPSSSPEHSFRDVKGEPRGVTEGSALDQQLYAQVFHRLLTLSRHFGQDNTLMQAVAQALPCLRSTEIGPDGRVSEWSGALVGAEPGHRHLSHLYAVYPGDGPVALGDPGMLDAFRRSLDDRLEHGTGQTGWSQSWILCLAARFGDVTLAQSSVHNLLTTLTTRALLVLHPYEGAPDNAVFQIDGNFGAAAGMLEMLVQSFDGLTVLMAALPSNWQQGRLGAAVIRGGHKVDLVWQSGRQTRVVIAAARHDKVTLDMPAGCRYLVRCVSDGLTCSTSGSDQAGVGRQRLTWAIQSGEVYEVSQADP